MGITMKEIAYLCGVSRGTVDRVLNNRGKVKPETEAHIRAVAKSMGYRCVPTVSSSPTHQRTMKIGVLINAIEHAYFTEILSGMMASLEMLVGYNISGIIKLSSSFDVDQQLRYLEEFMQQGVNAIAITAANSPRITQKLKEFSNLGIPVVLVSALLDGFEPLAFVGCNHYLGGRIAASFAKQVIPDGSKVAIVTSTRGMLSCHLRVSGFKDVLLAGCPNCTIMEPIESFDDDVIAYKALSGLLSRHQDIDLLFLAAGGYNGCFQAVNDSDMFGKMKIIAFDTPEVSVHYLRTGYVSALFHQKPVKQGSLAIKCLADYLLTHTLPENRTIYLPIEILVSESFYDPSEGISGNASQVKNTAPQS